MKAVGVAKRMRKNKTAAAWTPPSAPDGRVAGLLRCFVHLAVSDADTDADSDVDSDADSDADTDADACGDRDHDYPRELEDMDIPSDRDADFDTISGSNRDGRL